MGTSLSGLTPSATYTGLLKFGDNSAISASLKVISDGAGNDTILSLSTSSLNIGGTGLSARVGIKGSGSTSATTSLLVQNSAGSTSMQLRDDLTAEFNVPTGNLGVFTVNSSSNKFYIAPYGSTYGVILQSKNGAGGPYTPLSFFCSNIFAETPGGMQIATSAGSINASAKLQVDSTTSGFLPPRMTNAQRTAIASPAVGLMVYCTDAVEGLYVYKSTGWTFVI